jgi:hypothetical protein
MGTQSLGHSIIQARPFLAGHSGTIRTNNCQVYVSSPLNELERQKDYFKEDMWNTYVGWEVTGPFAYAEISVNSDMYFKKQLNSSIVNVCDALRHLVAKRCVFFPVTTSYSEYGNVGIINWTYAELGLELMSIWFMQTKIRIRRYLWVRGCSII